MKRPSDKYQVRAMSKPWSVHEWVFSVGWGIIWFPVAAECVISPVSPPQPPKDAAGLSS